MSGFVGLLPVYCDLPGQDESLRFLPRFRELSFDQRDVEALLAWPVHAFR